MKASTKDAIKVLLTADETVSPETIDAVLKTAQQPTPKRALINAKEAQEILGISRPTLREYVRRGVIEQVNLSLRKVRFDKDTVVKLAYSGINPTQGGDKKSN